jgi:hypothetical protein
MKSKFFKLFLLLFFVVICIQLIPKQNNNYSSSLSKYDIRYSHKMSDSLLNILQTSCFDCHSNHSQYPWYANIQPVSWWLNKHIDEGKEELNFSEFGRYSIRRQYHKLSEISREIEEDEMPLTSYTLIHNHSKLSMPQKKVIFEWINQLQDSFKLVYPPDSIKSRRK